MAQIQKGLGRGLNALFDDIEEVKKHLEDSLQHCHLSDEERCFCNNLLEEILHDRNTSNDAAWKIKDVIQFIKAQD